MFKKILYVSLFVLIFLLAVQSVSASDTDLNDINFNNIDSNDVSTNDIVLEDGEGSSDADENEVEEDSERTHSDSLKWASGSLRSIGSRMMNYGEVISCSSQVLLFVE